MNAGTAPTKPMRFWLIIAATAFVPAILSSLTAFLNSRLDGRTSWRDILAAAGVWLIFAPLTRIPYEMTLRWKIRRDQIARTLVVHLGGAAMMWLTWGTAGALLAKLINRIPPRVSFPLYYFSLLLTILPFCLLLYFAVVGCVHAFTYYLEVREREAQQAQLAAQLAEARLSALRSQLNPHFLFNSLNAITVLVRDQNTADASRMLELLSGVLRQVLQNEKRQEVTLNEELEFVRKYLAIEEVRFSDRLQLRWSIDQTVQDALVPEFILQPLVENAIRHGVTRKDDYGIVEITARARGDTLVLSVQDNGPGYRPVNDGGVGLSNTRARLATVFGDRGELKIANAESGGTVATLRFPLKK